MRKLLSLFFTVILITLSFSACKDDTKQEGLSDQEKTEINNWVWEEMDVYYLWTSTMPFKQSTTTDPKDYFSTLLNSKDKWSYITDDYHTWTNSLQGIAKSYGHSLALYWKDSSQSSVIAQVQFVYPNTPSDRAGIKRGDIIGKVNNTDLTNDNYYELLFETDQATFSFGSYNNTAFEFSDVTITVAAEEILENPVLHYEIIERDSKKMGYLVYVGFISNFNNNLNEALSYFKANNVDELILDLRYNPGGDLGAANELCSSIAPKEVVENSEILVKYNWNNLLQDYLTQQAALDASWNDNLQILFDNSVENNLNLSKVYILTTGGSASASELTLIGLEPYMDVIQIGETTHGKYAASITLPNSDSIWALQPIVLKYSNANNYTDFSDGLTPDFPVNDDLSYDFGDLRDPILMKAVELIIERPLTPEGKSATMRRNFGPSIDVVGRHEMIQDGITTIKLNKHLKSLFY